MKSNNYSFSVEKIPLDKDFPVFMFSYSISEEPIRTLHCHDVLEIGLCVKGNGIFIIDNNIYTYETGDIIIISPEVYHRAKSGTGMDDLWYFIYFQADSLQIPSYHQNTGKLFKYTDDTILNSLMNILIIELQEKKVQYQLSVQGLLKTIIVHILRLEELFKSKKVDLIKPKVQIDDRINTAIDILFSSKTLNCNIEQIAHKCNLSISHFRYLFKEQIGMSPKQFQIKLKIHTAIFMLKNNNLRILDISEECGFESLSSFNRLFKRETGFSPQQWRNNYKLKKY